MYTATPTKLRSGAWGARVESEEVEKGDVVEITTRSGKTWSATVSAVVWSGNGVAIVATQSDGRQASGRNGRQASGRRTGCSCGSVYGAIKSSDCWTCRHDA